VRSPGRLAFAALLLLAAPGCGGKGVAAPAEPRFPALTGRVVDEADLLGPAEERALADQSAAVERETGAQYVVVTLRSLQGYSIEDYGVRLGRRWGIGRKGADDGLMLIVAPAERKVRIEVGYGLEKKVTDPFADRVIRERLVPAFAKGRFADGIRAASDALVERLRSKAGAAEIRALDGVAT
jgi:uncharacterized protein